MVANDVIQEATENLFEGEFADKKSNSKVKWTKPNKEQKDEGYRVVLRHGFELTQVTWHRKGDYFASVAAQGQFILLYKVFMINRFQSEFVLISFFSFYSHCFRRERSSPSPSAQPSPNPKPIHKIKRNRPMCSFPHIQTLPLRRYTAIRPCL
jgi:hypothetical protein